MKAFVNEIYGPPEVLELKDIAKPEPEDHQILIKVNSLSINPAEWHILRATIWLVRFSKGLRKPKKKILGADVSGIVMSVGKNVTAFKPGDRVYGRTWDGGLAEYACLDENRAAVVPSKLSLDEIATIPLAAMTAVMALRDKGNIHENQRVLINGASGGIGTLAVQLANYYGAEVTGICSTKNIQLIKSLGTKNEIDYTKEDFTKTDEKYDVIIDLIGNRKCSELNKILSPNGKCVFVGFTSAGRMIGNMLRGTWISKTSSKEFVTMNAETTRADLEFMIKLMEQNKLVPIIDRTFRFEQMREAFAYLGTRRIKGKILIKL